MLLVSKREHCNNSFLNGMRRHSEFSFAQSKTAPQQLEGQKYQDVVATGPDLTQNQSNEQEMTICKCNEASSFDNEKYQELW